MDRTLYHMFYFVLYQKAADVEISKNSNVLSQGCCCFPSHLKADLTSREGGQSRVTEESKAIFW